MIYSKLKREIDEYNWDDGFEVPEKILQDPACDLALALEIFYLADGYGYLERSLNEITLPDWERFISKLYDSIINGEFVKTSRSFEIPLTKVQKYKLRQKGIDEIFLTDL